MKNLKTIWIFLTILSAVPALGQRRYVLADGITGHDRAERMVFILTFSPQSDTSFVVSDSLGRFEIAPEEMDAMRGNVYLKPVASHPKAKLTLVNPFDSIDAYRQGRERYLAQDHVFAPAQEAEAFYFDPDVTVLKEATVKARRSSVGRDKVTGYLDSLAILAGGEWVCEDRPGGEKYLNDYHGYSHHPEGCFDCKLPPGGSAWRPNGARPMPS